MLQCWAGHDFDEYLARDAVKQQESAQAAARWGRKNMQHREALVEYLTFRTPWQAREGGLFQVAWRVYGMWRHRRQYDFLWFPDRGPAAGPPWRDAEPDILAEPVDGEETSPETSGAGPSGGDRDGAEGISPGSGPGDAAGEAEPAAAGLEFRTMDAAADAGPEEPDFSAGFATADEETFGQTSSREQAPAESPHQAGTLAVDAEPAAAAAAVPADQFGSESPATANPVPNSDAELIQAMSPAAENSTPAPAESPPETAPVAPGVAVSDADLFQVRSQTEESPWGEDDDDAEPAAASGVAERELARLADLQWASRLLEAFLGVQPTGNFIRDAACLGAFLNQPNRLTAAVMLLMLYGLRRDYAGRRTDRQKVDLILQLGERLEQLPAEGPSREARQVFRSMLTDWQLERGDYSQIVERLTEYAQLTHYEWKALADAEAALARELTGQKELNDTLKYDALSHYFLAGHSSLWTLEYARTLLPVTTIEEYRKLLRANPVEITSATSKDVSFVVPSGQTAPPSRRPQRRP